MSTRVHNLILALDPSTTKTGYALLEPSLNPDRPVLHDAGLIVGSEERMDIRDPMQSEIMNSDALAAIRRIHDITGNVLDLLTKWRPKTVVVEVSSGMAGTGSNGGASSSLAIYGEGVGAVWMLAEVWSWSSGDRQSDVIPVTERLWTPWRGSKAAGQLRCRAVYPDQYDLAKDTGADISDAINLGAWWINWQSKPAAYRAAKLRSAIEELRARKRGWRNSKKQSRGRTGKVS